MEKTTIRIQCPSKAVNSKKKQKKQTELFFFHDVSCKTLFPHNSHKTKFNNYSSFTSNDLHVLLGLISRLQREVVW